MRKLLLAGFFLFAVAASAQIGTNAPWMQPFNDANRTTEPTFQEIVDAFEAYWADKDPSVKGSGYKPFKRWESMNEYALNPDGTVMSQMQKLELLRDVQSRSSQSDDSDWYSVGPLAHENTGSWSSGQGRVNVVAVDPNDANTIYIGAPAGGIWSSKDNGSSWTPLLDDFPQIGVSSIAIDKNNSNIIYIGTGDDDGGDSNAIGILKSVDAGITWSFTGMDETNSPTTIPEIYISDDDSNTLFAGTSSGIFKSTDAGATWTNVRSGNFFDIKIKPGDPNTIYGVTANQFFKSTDGGDSFVQITSGVPVNNGRMAIDVTAANPEVVYILAATSNFGFKGVYKSSDGADSFTEVSGSVGDIFESSQAWFDMALGVSDVDENELYTGVLNVWKSTTGGTSFTKVNNWNQPFSPSYTHADIHFLRFIDGRFFCGSDGGIYVSENGGANFTDLTEGLVIGQFYRIAVAKQDSQVISGGLQDNGGYARLNNEWLNYYGADGMEAAIDPNNPNNRYGFIQNGGGLYFSTDGGASLSGSIGAPDNGNWITPLEFTASGRLYAGYNRIYEFDFCSNSWQTTSSTFPGGRIDRLILDPNNEAIMYTAVNNRLFRSTNGGLVFNQIASFSSFISWVDVKNGDSNTLYITTSGTNGEVFIGTINEDESLDLNNITGSLPNLPKNVIKHQPLHGDDPLYLGTSVGVWRYDRVTNDWEPFSNGLPNTSVRDLEINVLDGNITAGTYGRGVWQTAIPQYAPDTDIAISQVTTADGAVACGATTLLVDVMNNGSNSVATISVDYEVDGTMQTFEWTGTLAAGATTTIELPELALTPGVYNANAFVTTNNDEFSSNNAGITSFAVNGLGEGDVINDFESESDALLVTGNTGGNCSSDSTLWERGTPEGALLNQTSSGTNAYGTNLNGNYPDNTLEYLVTPCYDLSTMANPELSFNMAMDLEIDYDILYMEYSTDQGDTWNILGTAADANWYNSDTAQGENGTCFNCPGNQWTGTVAEMTSYSYDLAALTNETNILFRFVFQSDQTVTQEGVVIDDFLINADTLGVDDALAQGISIYPNPSNGQFNITMQNTTTAAIKVFDITGKQVLSKPAFAPNGAEYTLDLSAFASGMYLLQAELDGVTLSRKLILN